MSSAGFTRKAAAMTTVTFDAPGLGDRSYLISDGEVGVVVDPQRDPFPYLQEAEKLGVSITAVLETHVHNDYLSGGLALSRATGATYAIPAGEPMSFSEEFRALDDGDTVAAGRLEATAIATAGHTAHHLAYLVKFADGGDDEEGGEHVVCTGGSLLVNATGRTDLLGLALAEPLAHSQWRSVRRLLTTLPKHARILPTHGFGSFCSATPTQGDVTGVPTIGRELEQNPAALLDEEDFVATLLGDPLPIPAYYRHMAPLNRKGPALPSFAPAPELDADALEDAIRGAEWVVDLRQRREFAAGHLPGTLNLELGVNLTTYLGWIVPWERRGPTADRPYRPRRAFGCGTLGDDRPSAKRSEVCQEQPAQQLPSGKLLGSCGGVVGPEGARAPGVGCPAQSRVAGRPPEWCPSLAPP